MAHFKVIIVGAGLAGSLLANGLINHGVEVTIYERDSEDSKREGYQIRLGDAALEAFNACLEPEQTTQIFSKFGQSSLRSSTAPTICNSQLRTILDLTQLPSYSRSYAINRVVLRNLLLAPVQKSGKIQFEKSFSRYQIVQTHSGEEKVKVEFTDGSSDLCDVLVAADGSSSKINKQVGLNNIHDIDTHWSFLHKGSLSPNLVQTLPSRLLKGPILVFSKGISLFYSLYLPTSEDNRTESRDGIKYNTCEASFYWGLNIPNEGTPYHEVSEIADPLTFCLEAIKDWAPEYHQMISLGGRDSDTPIKAVTLRASTRPVREWRHDPRLTQLEQGHARVWLIGDAIHAMQPNRGMGGNQAMHDCCDVLPHLLNLDELATSGNTPSTEDISQSVSSYEPILLDRAFAWVRKSGGHKMVNINLGGSL